VYVRKYKRYGAINNSTKAIDEETGFNLSVVPNEEFRHELLRYDPFKSWLFFC